MSEESTWKEDLVEKYPDFFRSVYPCVGDGWSGLLQALCLNIEHYLEYTNKIILSDDSLDIDADDNSMYEFSFSQIKEKFGCLRIYYNGGDEFIAGAISFAEIVSDRTCEVCGGKGKRRSTAWTSTLCDEHYADRKALDDSSKQKFEEQQLDMWNKKNRIK